MSTFNRIPWLAGVALLSSLLLGTTARSDDTEIFLSQIEAGEAGRANILFIIDNSGSMDTLVQTQADWDPATTFSGCYDSNAIYFSGTTAPPPCGSTAFFTKAANRCAASATPLANLGQFGGAALAWDATRERWEPLAADQPDRPVECEADRGVEGDGPGAESFAANGPEGPWAADESQEPAWNTQQYLFDGNWLNWQTNPPSVTRTRLAIVQNVVNQVVGSLDGVNVGLMTFNFEEGGTVLQSVQNVDTTAAAMKAAVDALTPTGFTPLSETLYEAALYLRGGLVDYGNVGPQRSVAASRVGNSATGTQYLTPLTADCQKTFIVLLTDGAPTRDTDANTKIRSLPGFGALLGNCDGFGEGACLDDLAEYLYRTDANPDLDGEQNIVTYTIGFDVDINLLESTAERGGGQYYLADDTGSLTAALTELVGDILQGAGVFAAPTIPVSAFGSTASDRDVYVSLFQPTERVHWPGNLKKYRFDGTQLLDQDGKPAVDPLTGFFDADATSFWSATVDGDRVPEGGAASRLPTPSLRKVYTDVAGPTLTATDNRVDVANTAITAAMLGVAETERSDLIRWIRGTDVRDVDGDGNTFEARREMGDPLHVRPVTTNYGSSAANPDTVVFVATNDGLLHAVDADTGVEIWSYLPSRLLSRQYELFLDNRSATRRYGLDGEIRLFSGTPAGADSGRKILVFGMGRGGDAVFAVDVTARNAPRLLWQIDSSSDGFASLGQTWAAPVVANLDIGGSTRTALVLGGGYDDSQDNRGLQVDNAGNAVFIVDLETGERLWSAGAPSAGHDLELENMQQSIPAAPRVIDLTGDGLADRLYVGDMGGRVWRFDFINGNSRASFGAANILASLGAGDLASPTGADVRRFYNTPDVVLVQCLRGTFLAVNIGSGYRGHPLDTDVADAFFSIRDPNVFGPFDPDAAGEPIGIGDLQDITDFPEAVVPADSAGWLLRMVEEPGEKILSSSLTFDNTIFFQSFAPGDRVSACSGGLGVNRAYQVDVCNGRPVNNLDNPTEPGPLSVDDRFVMIGQTGIAPEAVFLFSSRPGDGPTRCIGLQCFPPDPDAGGVLNRTYWMQESGR
jgi:type IV pilus assembly protein PilY1